MNYEDLKEIIYLLGDKDISELAIERGNEAVRIKRFVAGPNHGQLQSVLAIAPGGVSMTAMPRLAREASGIADETGASTAVETEPHLLKSHTVGIFRETKDSKTRPPVEPGDAVEANQVVGFIEVLRLLHDVRSDVAGQVITKLISDGQPVEYGQPLFTIHPQE